MPSIINTNIASLNTQRNLNTSQAALGTSIQRLSSGLRVNSAKDDAAGLAIAERMNAQVRGLNVAARNANDGVSLAQTAEGALGKIGDMVQRIRELAVQSVNATNSTDDRSALNAEVTELLDEIRRVADTTNFNGTPLLDGSFTGKNFQVGADSGQVIPIATIVDARLDGLFGAGTHPDISSDTGAAAAITVTDAALNAINSARATLGAIQSRFESAISNIQIAAENTTAARSRIMDTDFAAETAALTRAQILQQAGNAMLAQANQLPQQVLSLLKG